MTLKSISVKWCPIYFVCWYGWCKCTIYANNTELSEHASTRVLNSFVKIALNQYLSMGWWNKLWGLGSSGSSRRQEEGGGGGGGGVKGFFLVQFFMKYLASMGWWAGGGGNFLTHYNAWENSLCVVFWIRGPGPSPPPPPPRGSAPGGQAICMCFFGLNFFEKLNYASCFSASSCYMMHLYLDFHRTL